MGLNLQSILSLVCADAIFLSCPSSGHNTKIKAPKKARDMFMLCKFSKSSRRPRVE